MTGAGPQDSSRRRRGDRSPELGFRELLSGPVAGGQVCFLRLGFSGLKPLSAGSLSLMSEPRPDQRYTELLWGDFGNPPAQYLGGRTFLCCRAEARSETLAAALLQAWVWGAGCFPTPSLRPRRPLIFVFKVERGGGVVQEIGRP